MITDFDDYPIHQTAEPVEQPVSGDRNFYDRYWFGGFDKACNFYFEVGFGLYPNRAVMDGHFSVAFDGKQHSFHSSRRAPRNRAEMDIGPMSIEVVKPLRVIRVRVAPNDTGIECDLTFSGITIAIQEPKNNLMDGVRSIMDVTRLTQYGRWSGYFSVNGKRTEVRGETTMGVRDRSWGVRPIGEPEGGAPGVLSNPQNYWIWAPLHFDDRCIHYCMFQQPDGTPIRPSGSVIPTYPTLEAIPKGEDKGIRETHNLSHTVSWVSGTRRPAGANLALVTHDGERHEVTLEAKMPFYMKGIGYSHPEWKHAAWKGELVYEGESWDLDKVAPLDFTNIHVHCLCEARMGDKVGVGILETVVFGRHDPSGFKDILDGAP